MPRKIWPTAKAYLSCTGCSFMSERPSWEDMSHEEAAAGAAGEDVLPEVDEENAILAAQEDVLPGAQNSKMQNLERPRGLRLPIIPKKNR